MALRQTLLGVTVDQSKEKPGPRLIDNRNRIALTREAMAALGVSSGDYVILDVQGGQVRVLPVEWKVKKP